MVMHVKLKVQGVATLNLYVRFTPINNCILNAIGMTSESPLRYYEFLDEYCTTTPIGSPNSILQIYGSSNSLMH